MVFLSCFSSPNCLKMLSWNIDGLDDSNIVERTLAVCEFIRSHTPHAVYLQEVIASTMVSIGDQLCTEYDCYSSPSPPMDYYPAILVRKTEIETMGPLECFNFPHSDMGRHLLQLPVKFSGVEIQLMTSHLESMEDCDSERKQQLNTVFEFMTKLQQSKICIFGGDLNVRDAEVNSVGLPEKTVDVWEACGSQEEHKYTRDILADDWWYPDEPKLRLDRLYLCPRDRQLHPTSFALVGKERLPGIDRFPSDHWGIWAEFEVRE